MKGTHTLAFIKTSELPKDKNPTYLHICADYQPQKDDPYQICFTIGGNPIYYPGDTYTPNGDLTTAKLLFNSTISTPNARFMFLDISNFHLNTTFKPQKYECMWIPFGVRDTRRHLRFATSRTPILPESIKTSCGSWILTHRKNTRSLQTQYPTHQVQSCR